jgi:hemerythrin
MGMSNFSGRLNHERDHDHLLKGLSEYISYVVDDAVPVSPALGEYLKRWVIYHEKKFDHPFLEFIQPSNGCQKECHAVQ